MPGHRHVLNKKFLELFVLVILVTTAAYVGMTYWQSHQLEREYIPAYTPRQTKTYEVAIMVPENEQAYVEAMRQAFSNADFENTNPSKYWNFIKKVVTVRFSENIAMREAANAAAGEISTFGGPAKASIVYLRIVSGTVYTSLDIDLDGWAGSSFSAALIHPLVEKTLLQFPEIHKVVFGAAPGESLFCGGLIARTCPGGYVCKLDGNYPDAGGVCLEDTQHAW